MIVITEPFRKSEISSQGADCVEVARAEVR
jgi:hypothetical protein